MFAGLLSIERPLADWGDADRMLHALAPFNLQAPRAQWRANRQMLLQVATQHGASTAEIYLHPHSGVAVAFWGRLDNRSDLIAQLNACTQDSDDALVCLAWLKWAELCPEHLIGDFAFAVASPKTGSVFLARDVMGVKPLYYRCDANGVFFASSAAAFKPLLVGTLTLREVWMAKFMLGISYSHADTAYAEITKLPGAHSLLIQADGSSIVRRYHQFIDDAPTEKTRDPKWLEAYTEIWQEAVACRVPESELIASENSGGIDSGSITAEIARQLGEDTHRLFSMGFCYEPLEPEFIMATAMKYKLRNNLLMSDYSEYDFDAIRQREHRISGFPHEHGNGTSHFPFYQECQARGIRVLHSGFGGDEVVTNSAIPVRLELFDRHDWLGLWRILFGSLPMRAGRFAKTILRGVRPKPQFNAGFLPAWQFRWSHNILHPEIIAQHDLQSAYFATAVYDEQFRSVNAFAMARMAEPFVPTRLENCTLMAASYGVDYAWPMWDQRLVQQWLSTPSIWKMGDGGIGRYLHRRAVAEVSAPMVAWKPSKDMGHAFSNAKINNESNIPTLQKLLDQLEVLPQAMQSIIDVPRAKAMAQRGIKEDWRSADRYEALTTLQDNVCNLSDWLAGEPCSSE